MSIKYNNYILKVLIIDDEEGMCKATTRVLDKFVIHFDDLTAKVNFEISYCTSGADFLGKHLTIDYDLYLVDYKLPDINGIQIIEHIKSKKVDSLIIMITAYATLETAINATKKGAFDFIAKPFSPDELRHAINKATYHYLLSSKAKNLEDEKKKVRFQFISVLAHELKSPLNAIEGYVDLLENNHNLSEQDFNNVLNRTKLRITGMRKLIFDLLDLTRIESGEKLRSFQNINFNDIIKSSIEMLNIDAQKRNISINYKPIDVFMDADKNEIEIIVNNLISNAIKYNKNAGTVNVELVSDNDKIKIIVSDTGIGIEEEQMSKIFTDFFRIKNKNTVNILGSGLGLSTIHKIVKLYNGSIDVTSKIDEGTTFAATLSRTL